MSENKLKHFKLENVSVVILAQTHNPSIINIDFLKNNEIIDDDWELQRAAISSPAVALMDFKNGVHWQVNYDSLIVRKGCTDNSPDTHFVYDCAKKYVQALEHIPYKAIGMNWCFSDNRSQNIPMKDRFLREGVWKSNIELSAIAFKVLPAWSLALQKQGETKHQLDCNYHTDLSQKDDKVKKICSAIGEAEKHKNTVMNYIKEYFEDDLV